MFFLDYKIKNATREIVSLVVSGYRGKSGTESLARLDHSALCTDGMF
jgi:hypothetical protein